MMAILGDGEGITPASAPGIRASLLAIGACLTHRALPELLVLILQTAREVGPLLNDQSWLARFDTANESDPIPSHTEHSDVGSWAKRAESGRARDAENIPVFG
jgi:hypothetical protein